jgi:hypothetical protein
VNHRLVMLCLTGGLTVAAAGCRSETSAQPPIMLERNMFQQQRYNPQARSKFFTDGRAMRTPVEHTQSRDYEINPEIVDGELADGSGYVLSLPDPVLAQLGGLAGAVRSSNTAWRSRQRSTTSACGTCQMDSFSRPSAAAYATCQLTTIRFQSTIAGRS